MVMIVYSISNFGTCKVRHLVYKKASLSVFDILNQNLLGIRITLAFEKQKNSRSVLPPPAKKQPFELITSILHVKSR